MGENTKCNNLQRPSFNDILIGLNFDLDPTRNRNSSGQIYTKTLKSESKAIVNTPFVPVNTFMITYDDVLPSSSTKSNATAAFQIFLSTDSTEKSYVIFKFKSCLKGNTLYASSGLTYQKNDNQFHEIIIPDGQQCTGNNMDQPGLWLSEVTNFIPTGKNLFANFLKNYKSLF
jgi:hypothetical protein